jgi:hypothetical protein
MGAAGRRRILERNSLKALGASLAEVYADAAERWAP